MRILFEGQLPKRKSNGISAFSEILSHFASPLMIEYIQEVITVFMSLMEASCVQCHGFFIFNNIIGLGLFGTARARAKLVSEIGVKEGKNPFAFVSMNIDDFHVDQQRDLPQISLVMSCKGVHSGSISNWRTQLSNIYGGNLEYVFITESEEDPAHKAIKSIMDDPEFANHKITLCVAGITWHSSQKCHNILEGLINTSSDSEYCLFIDDDIELHPGTIRSLVYELENDPTLFSATGYSFDIPDPTAAKHSLGSYMMICYRLLALAGFSTERPSFMWGGCMMLRRKDAVGNGYHMIDQFRDGGYSDDMIITTFANQNSLTVAAPRAAIFPNVVDSDVSIKRYLNFTLRQIFTLTTYNSTYMRFYHLCLLFTNIGGTVIMGAFPLVLAAIQLVSWATSPLSSFSFIFDPLGADFMCTLAIVTLIIFFISFVAFTQSIPYIFNTLASTCNRLSPKNHSEDEVIIKINYWKLTIALLIHITVFVVGTVYVFFSRSIVWAGIRYRIGSDGRVDKVTRYNENGEPYSIDRDESLRNTLADHISRGFPYDYEYDQDKFFTDDESESGRTLTRNGASDGDGEGIVTPRRSTRIRKRTV